MTAERPDLKIEKFISVESSARLEDLIKIYVEVYSDQLDDPFFSAPRYRERLEGYSSRSGFSVALGYVDSNIIGYALGYTLPAGSGWWSGLRSRVPSDITAENGNRTFALNEIMVLEQWRRRHYARELHDALLADRSEERATLLVLPGNTPACKAYKAWNWHKLGELKPFNDSPVYDAMIRPLKG
ncbi:GNAT family N-acetyltransferase [Actinoplanes sp. NPDC051859]|uniref:GNAT family N-acetyltransferase n=1 Tax=Actinoplanes sp. NPDC051859 TaxID=3363909 RepID=UPI00379E0425